MNFKVEIENPYKPDPIREFDHEATMQLRDGFNEALEACQKLYDEKMKLEEGQELAVVWNEEESSDRAPIVSGSLESATKLGVYYNTQLHMIEENFRKVVRVIGGEGC